MLAMFMGQQQDTGAQQMQLETEHPGAAECGPSSNEVPPDLYQRLRSISLEEARLIIQRIDRKYIDQEAIGGGTLTTWSAEFHRPGIIEFLLELGAASC